MPFIECPACNKQILVEDIHQASKIFIHGCRYHSQAKDFEGHYYFKYQEELDRMTRTC